MALCGGPCGKILPFKPVSRAREVSFPQCSFSKVERKLSPGNTGSERMVEVNSGDARVAVGQFQPRFIYL